MSDNFAKPVSGLGVPALGNLGVSAYPAGGQGFSLDPSGQIPFSLLATLVVFATGTSAATSATVSRAGDYLVLWQADCTATALFWQDVITATTGTLTGGYAAQMTDGAAGQRDSLSGIAKLTGCAAGTVVAHGITGQSSIQSAQLAIIPMRVF